MKFKRNCPKCKVPIFYNRKDSLQRAINQKRMCFNCNTPKGNKHYRFGKHCSQEIKDKIRKTKMGVPIHTIEEKEKRRLLWCGDKNPNVKYGPSFLGRHHTEETKEKMRISYVKTVIKNGGRNPRFNLNAINYFKKLELEFNWNGIYATKNSEYFIESLGYFVDYYEPHLNIVVEYDEPRHYYANGTLKQKDIKRMEKIISKIDCKFYRYDEKRNLLKEYFIDSGVFVPTLHH